MNKTYNHFLTTENTVIAYNTKICNLKVTGATLDGAYIGRVNATIQHVHRTPQEVTLQLQARLDYLKCINVTLRQRGNDVTARIDWAKYTSAEHNCGYDFVEDRKRCAEWQKTAFSSSSEGYGVAELQLENRKPRKALIDGSNIVLHRKHGSKYLAHLIECLWIHGYEPSVLFDATIPHNMQEAGDKFGLDLLKRLKQESDGDDVLVPACTSCDDYLLAIAKMHGCPIISYDAYRNHDKHNRPSKYRKGLIFTGGDMVIRDLGGRDITSTLPVNIGVATIRASVNGKFLCADIGSENVRPVIANRDSASDWETFTILPNNDRTVSLKSNANGRYLSAEINGDCRLNARAVSVDAWEKFWLKEMDGKWTLRSYANGKYVSVNPYTGIACACAAVPNDWEFLEIFYRD